MTSIFSIVNIAAPLLLITLGALISEYAGRMALFLDGIINLGAFLCYLFLYLTGNFILAFLISTILCIGITLLFEITASKLNANMFLASLAMNILFTAVATLLSSVIFKTRGVLYSTDLILNPGTMRTITSVICYSSSILLLILLKSTSTGLSLRICGSDPEVLKSKGLSPSFYKSLSWIITAGCGTFAGCTLALRLSSYVPGMAGGRGWTALAAVFLGRKNPVLVAIAVFVFAVSEFLSINIQNISAFRNLPSSILISLPYLIALLLILVVPGKKEN